MAPRNEERPPPAPRLFSRLSHISNKSFRSHSSSFQADDERSSSSAFSSDDLDRMTSNSNGHVSPPARYPGEDSRPTSQKELAGWYMYGFAAETYVICG